jgi:hypothetical protein
MSPNLPLTRRQHEMITTLVWVANRCHYRIESSAELWVRVTLDEALVNALQEDYRTAPISETDGVMLD